MKAKCCKCNQEFEVSFIMALAYALDDELEHECSTCAFGNVFDKLDKDFFNLTMYDDTRQLKSLEQILSELGNRWHEGNIKIENKSYGSKDSSGIFGHKPSERSGIFRR